MRKRDELTKGCMAKAHDEEMTFTLLGRDAAAPSTIRFWIAERIRLGKNTPGDAQLTEAEACAQAMENDQRIALIDKKYRVGLDESELAEWDRLQALCFARLDAQYPESSLDMERLDKLEARLKPT